MDTWNKRLTVAMASRGRSGTDVAKAVGVSNATVSDWMHGEIDKITAENNLRLCRFLHVSPMWLQFGEGAMDEIMLTADDHRAINTSRALGARERAAWYRVGASLTEPDEGTNGK